MELREVTNDPWILTREAYAIYGQCMYKAGFEDYREEMARLRESPGCSVFVCRNADEPAGMIATEIKERAETGGTEDGERGTAEIIGIAVKKEARGTGIGRYMVFAAARMLNVRALTAETDDDAVGFYQKTGFTCIPFERHFSDGTVRRYRCELTLR